MATTKIPFVKYRNNMKKSISYITSDMLQSQSPVINAYHTQINDIRKEVIMSSKSSNVSVKELIKTNLKKTLAPISDILDKAREDLRTGKFYDDTLNDDSSDMDNMGLGLEDASDSGFNEQPSGSIDVSGAISGTAFNNLSSTTLAGSQYMAEVSMNNTSQMMSMSMDHHKELLNSVNNLQNIGMSIVNFNNNVVKSNLEKANAYYDQALSKLDEIKEAITTQSSIQLQLYGDQNGYKDSASQISKILDSSTGTVNLKSYFEHIKKNVGNMIPFNLDDLTRMLGEHPIAALGKAMISGIMPKNVKSSITDFNTMIGSLFPMFLMQMNNVSSNGNSQFTRTLANIFKVDTKRNTGIGLASYRDAPVTLELEQKKAKAITEVIPTYLSEITRALTGSNMLFDYSKGKFIKKEKMQKEAKSVIRNQLVSNMSNTYETLGAMATSMKLDKETHKSLINDIESFIEFSALRGEGINPYKKLDPKSLAKAGLKMNDWNNLALIMSMIASMPKTGQATMNSEFMNTMRSLQESLSSINQSLNSSGTMISLSGFEEGLGGLFNNIRGSNTTVNNSSSTNTSTGSKPRPINKFKNKQEAVKFFNDIVKNGKLEDLKTDFFLKQEFGISDENDEDAEAEKREKEDREGVFNWAKDKLTGSKVGKKAIDLKNKLNTKMNNLTQFVSDTIDTISNGIYGVMFDNKSPSGVIGHTLTSIGKVIDKKAEESEWFVDAKSWIPKSMIAGGAGALLGKLGGTNAFGMMALPFMSAGITFLHNSQKMQNVLFGEFDENGKKIDGKEGIFKFVDKKTKDAIVKFLPKAKNGAIVGGLAGLVFKHPILGASVGAAVNLLKSTKMVQDFLWGNEETGDQGLLGGVKKWFTEKKTKAKNWISEKSKPMFDKIKEWLGLDQEYEDTIFDDYKLDEDDDEYNDAINSLNNAKIGNDADSMIATEFKSGIPDITNGNIIDYRKYFASIIDRIASIEASMNDVKDVRIIYGQNDMPVYVQMINPDDEEVNKVMKQNSGIPTQDTSSVSSNIVSGVTVNGVNSIANKVKSSNDLKFKYNKRNTKYKKVMIRQIRNASADNREYETIVNNMSDEEFANKANDIINNPNVDKKFKKKVEKRLKTIEQKKKSQENETKSKDLNLDKIFEGLDFGSGSDSRKSITNMGKLSGGLVGATLGSMILGHPLAGLYAGIMLSNHKNKDYMFKRGNQIKGALGGGILSSMMGLGMLPGMAFGSIFNKNSDTGNPKLMDHITGGGKLAGMGIGALGGLLISNPLLGAALGLAMSSNKGSLKSNTLNENITNWFSSIRGEDTSNMKLMDQLTGGGKRRGAFAGLGLGALFGGPLGALIGLGTGLATSSHRSELGDEAKGGIINRLTGIKSGKGWALGGLAGLALGHPIIGSMLGAALSKNGAVKNSPQEKWWNMLSDEQRISFTGTKEDLYNKYKDDDKYGNHVLWWNSLSKEERKKIKKANKGKSVEEIYNENESKNGTNEYITWWNSLSEEEQAKIGLENKGRKIKDVYDEKYKTHHETEKWWNMLSDKQRDSFNRIDITKIYNENKNKNEYMEHNLWWNSLSEEEQAKIGLENKGKKIKDVYEEKYKDADEKKGLFASLNGKFNVSKGKASAYGGILASAIGVNPLIGMAAGALLGGKKNKKPDGTKMKPYYVRIFDTLSKKEKKLKDDSPIKEAFKSAGDKIKGLFGGKKDDEPGIENEEQAQPQGGRGFVRRYGRGTTNASKNRVNNIVDKYMSYSKSKSADQVDSWYNNTLKDLSPEEAKSVMARVDSLNSNNTATAVKSITTDEKGNSFSLGGIFGKIGSFLSNLLPIGIALYQFLRLKGGGGFGSENEYGDANFANAGDRGLHGLTAVAGGRLLSKAAGKIAGAGGWSMQQMTSGLVSSHFYGKQAKAWSDRGDTTGELAEARYGQIMNGAKAVGYAMKAGKQMAKGISSGNGIVGRIAKGIKTFIEKLMKKPKVAKLLSKAKAKPGDIASRLGAWAERHLIPRIIKRGGEALSKILMKVQQVASVVLAWLPLATGIVAFINGWNNVNNELQLSSDYKPSWKERLACAIVYAIDDYLCNMIDIIGLRDDIISWLLNLLGVNVEERAASKAKAATEYEQFLQENDLNREGFTMEQYQNLTNKTIWGHVKSVFGGNNIDDYKKGGKKNSELSEKYGGYQEQESSDGITNLIVQDNSITNIQGSTGGRGIDPYLLKTKMRVVQTTRTNEDVAAKVLSGNLASSVLSGDKKTLNDINNKTGGAGKKNGIWARIKGVASNAGNWIKSKVTSGIQAVRNFFTGGRGDDDYYNQQDPRWANMDFGRYAGHRDTVGDGGCGPTTAAMAIQDLTGKRVTPAETSRYALSNGYKLDDGGTTPDYFNSIGKKYGVNFSEINPFGNDTISSLRNGNPVIFMGQDRTGTSPFGSNSHYVIANGMDNNGNVMVRDPKRSENNGMWNIADIAANSTNAIAGGRGGSGRYPFGGRGGLGSSEVKEFSLANDGEKNISTNFKVKEFACHDGGDTIKIGVGLVNGLEKLRAYIGKPLTINSAYRSPSYNSSIGGAKKSNHMKGIAADISATNLGITPIQLAAIAKHIGFTGVIYYDTFVHMDTRADCGMDSYYGKSLGGGKYQVVLDFGPLPESANGSAGSVNTSVGTTTSSGTSSNSSSTSDDGTEGKGFGSRVSNFLKKLGGGNIFFDRISNFTTALSNRFYGTAEASTSESGDSSSGSVTGGSVTNTVTGQANSSSSSFGTTSRTGTVTLPENLGQWKSFMAWQKITDKSSDQYKLRSEVGEKYDNDGFGIIDGRYAVATTTTFGKPGDYVDIYLSDGNTIPGVIADTKRMTDKDANKWGHDNGKTAVEFIIDRHKFYSAKEPSFYCGKQTNVYGAHPEWQKKYVTKIENLGNYWGRGGRGSNTHARVVPPSIRVANVAQQKSINAAKRTIKTASSSISANNQRYTDNYVYTSGGRDNSNITQHNDETMKNMVNMMNSMLIVLENIANTNAVIASNSKQTQISHKASLMNDIVSG